MPVSDGVRRYRDFYAMKPGAPIYQCEFGFYVLDRWRDEGHIPPGAGHGHIADLFGFDECGWHNLGNLGWCEAGFEPCFETRQVADLGEWELVRDTAGRTVKYFKNRRSGFMPEYVGHPVTDQKSWAETCLWRLDPLTPARRARQEAAISKARAAISEGRVVVGNLVGGYMYLRSLIGPVELLYMLVDDPRLIHACMEAWLNLADSYYGQVQQAGVVIDEIFLAEDICFNHGLLISPAMVREFLFPYYRQLLANVKARQGSAPLLHVDTDGFSDAAIALYKEIGLRYLLPFEVASGCDVVRTGLEHPDLLISGGFDKRVLAAGKDAIDREVDRILPVMRQRGGFYPTCDHGVPEEVSFDNYTHFRKRLREFA